MADRRFWNFVTLFLALGLGSCFIIVIWTLNASSARLPVHVVSTPTARTARDNPPIRAVMDYVPGKEETILHTIQVLIAMSEQMGNDVEVEGWGAIRRGDDWEVEFCFVENGTRVCATFWHDPVKGTVAPKDYWGKLYFDAAKAW